MDKYFPSTSAEYQAHNLVADGVWWNPNIGPVEIGLCAAYAALDRYVRGEDLYLPPRDIWELQAVLRLYSDHVINSLFSQIRSWSPTGHRTPPAYASARQQCARSLHAVLSPGDTLHRLVELHSPPTTPHCPSSALESTNDDATSSTAFEPTTASQVIRSR